MRRSCIGAFRRKIERVEALTRETPGASTVPNLLQPCGAQSRSQNEFLFEASEGRLIGGSKSK